MEYRVIRSEDRSDDAIEHAIFGGGRQKGAQNKNHKYLARAWIQNKWRYAYTQAEVRALENWGKAKDGGLADKQKVNQLKRESSEAKKAADKIEKQAKSTVTKTVDNAKSEVVSKANIAKTTATRAVDTAKNAVSKSASNVAKTVKEKADDIKTGVASKQASIKAQTAANDAKSVASNAAKSAKNKVSSTAEKGKAKAEEILNKASSTAKSAADKVSKIANDVDTTIQNAKVNARNKQAAKNSMDSYEVKYRIASENLADAAEIHGVGSSEYLQKKEVRDNLADELVDNARKAGKTKEGFSQVQDIGKDYDSLGRRKKIEIPEKKIEEQKIEEQKIEEKFVSGAKSAAEKGKSKAQELLSKAKSTAAKAYDKATDEIEKVRESDAMATVNKATDKVKEKVSGATELVRDKISDATANASHVVDLQKAKSKYGTDSLQYKEAKAIVDHDKTVDELVAARKKYGVGSAEYKAAAAKESRAHEAIEDAREQNLYTNNSQYKKLSDQASALGNYIDNMDARGGPQTAEGKANYRKAIQDLERLETQLEQLRNR